MESGIAQAATQDVALRDINPFQTFHDLGYRNLVPVIPPSVPVSENSTVWMRMQKQGRDDRGKVPGIRGRDGRWFSFDWRSCVPDAQDILRWHAMGAGVGIRTGDGLLAIDADTLDQGHAATIEAVVREQFGVLPTRIGRAPKALYLLRTTEPVPYHRVEFGGERVELLTEGRFFVAWGVHPATGKPYRWPVAPVPWSDIPEATPAVVAALMDALRAVLPEASKVIKEGGGETPVNQATLRGDPAAVRRAVDAIPNTSEHFPSRETYRDMGYAIKAAVEDEHEAFAIFEDWCARWTEGTNDPDVIRADWARMKPPFRRGAPWLYELADRLSGGAFDLAGLHFTPVAPPTISPFDVQAAAERAEDTETVHIEATPFGFPDPARIQPRQWLYGHHYIRKFVSATVAPSGAGKSSLALVEALAMASGKPLLGVTPKVRARVWVWNGEDPRDELERRVTAAMLHYGLTRDDIEDRLFLDSGRETEIVLAADTRDGARISAPVVAAITQTLLKNRIDALVIDPFISSHRVSENDNVSIDLVTKQWARVADECRCSVELVHHVRKLNGGETTVEDSRGAVSLLATARSARAISRMTRPEAIRLGLENIARSLFRFSDGKNNLAPPADAGTDWMRLLSVPLGNGPGGSEFPPNAFEAGGGPGASGPAVADLAAVLDGDSVGVVTLFSASAAAEEAAKVGDDAERAAVLAELRDGGAAGHWRVDPRSPHWAGHAVATALGLDVTTGEGKARASAVLAALRDRGALRFVWRPDERRRKRQFVEIPEPGEEAFG